MPEKKPEAPPSEYATLITNDHNYTSEAVLTPPELETAAGVDLTIRWDMLNIDMQCHDMDPVEDIDKVALIRFRTADKEAATALLTAGELDQSAVDGYLQYDIPENDTSMTAKLTDLTVFGSPVNTFDEYKPSDTQAYMMLWGTTTIPGVGARTMTFLVPSEDSNVTVVNAPIPCDRAAMTSILDFQAFLSDKPAAAVTEDPERAYVIDWRGVTKDSLQNPFLYTRVTDILLGFYEGMTPADLEERILDIESQDLATHIWEAEHAGGKQAALSALKDRYTGDEFTGFEGYPEGTWLFALRCWDCQNPSPLVLTVLTPPAGN